MWVKRSEYDKLVQEISALKTENHNLRTNPKQWSDSDLSIDLVEHIARVNGLHCVSSTDNSFFLLQKHGEEKLPGDGLVW